MLKRTCDFCKKDVSGNGERQIINDKQDYCVCTDCIRRWEKIQNSENPKIEHFNIDFQNKKDNRLVVVSFRLPNYFYNEIKTFCLTKNLDVSVYLRDKILRG